MSTRAEAACPSRRAARRNVRLYLLGMSAALLGGSAMNLTAGIWVKSLTGSNALAGLVAACIYAPSMAGPLAGLLVDRVRRRPLLVVVNAATGAVMLTMLLVQSEDQLWLIFVAMTCYGAAMALIDPAEQALFVVMLPLEDRQRINGLRMSIQEGGKLVAPLAGAGLFTLLGGEAVAASTSVTFVVAALSIARLRLSEPEPSPATTGWMRQLVAGFGHIRRDPALRTVAVSATVAMFVSGTFQAANFALVEALGRPPSFLGVLSGLLGAGSIVAGVVSARLVRRHGEATLLTLGLVAGCGSYVSWATGMLPIVLVGAGVMGFALPWVVIAVVNLGQRRTPVELQGRVAAATTLLLFAHLPIAQLIGVAAITVVPYTLVYLGGAVVCAVVLVYVRIGFRADSRARL